MASEKLTFVDRQRALVKHYVYYLSPLLLVIYLFFKSEIYIGVAVGVALLVYLTILKLMLPKQAV